MEEIITETAAILEEGRQGKTTDMRDWKSDIERKLEERRKAEEKREADRKAAEKRRLAEEKREAERRYVSEVKEHMRRYKCHICREPSEGPTYVEAYSYEDPSDEIAVKRYADAHYEWDMPIGLRKCTICGEWCCEERHIHKDVCERCFRKGYMPGDKRKWWDVEILDRLIRISYTLLRKRHPYEDPSDEIAVKRYVDAHYEWHMPIGLRKCTICGEWCCEERHIHKDVCERCFRKGYMPGDKRKWRDVEILDRLIRISYTLLRKRHLIG